MDSTPAKPKIALLLSGLPRMWRESLPTQLGLFRGYETDVFFHFWDVIDDAEKAEIIALLKPRANLFQAPQDFSGADTNTLFQRDFINPPSRILSQFYSWRGVARLFEPFKNDYDMAMRSRADLQFVYGIDHIFPHITPNAILMPWWDENKLLSDMFALGGVEPILYYHSIYDYLGDYAKQRIFNPELLLTYHFERRPDLTLYIRNFSYFFIRRPHMAGYTIEQAMAENPGRNKWLDPEVVAAHTKFHTTVDGDKGTAHVEHFMKTQLAALTNERIAKPKE